TVSGDIDGGGGTDTLDYGALAGPININLENSTATGITGVFASIENLIGSLGGDTLIGANNVNTWTISGADAGDVDGFAFTGIEILTGGTATDTFNLNNDVTGTISGGAGNDVFNYTAGVAIGILTGSGGTDTLVGDNVVNTWTISGVNSGTLNAQAYTSMENLTGSGTADAFVFTGGSVGGDINGAGGTDTLDYSGLAGPVNVDLTNSTATGIGGVFAGIENLIGSAGSDTLIGANDANTWTVNVADGGSVDGFAFANIENLTGGMADDVFNLSAGVNGTMDGGAGNDTFNIVGNFTAPGATLTLIGETVSNTAGRTISGAGLIISANTIGTSANALLTDVDNLAITTSGNVFVTEANDIELEASTIGGVF